MKGRLVNIYIACGSGVATSTIAGDAVSEIAAEEKIRIHIVKGTLSGIPLAQKSSDLILSTARYEKPVEKPFLCVTGLVSGIHEEETREEVRALLRQISQTGKTGGSGQK
ncbi:MAG: PTS galactitol transporter subunit IIB [Eubacteriales bacterium]|jgi:PTS system galactitol-specific IIB component